MFIMFVEGELRVFFYSFPNISRETPPKNTTQKIINVNNEREERDEAENKEEEGEYEMKKLKNHFK